MTTEPNYAVPTGDFIAEWMDDAGINAAELSRRLGTSRKHVSELIGGKAPLTHTVALELEDVTGIPARIWNQYETLYREDLARLEANVQLAEQYDQAKQFPLSYLRKYGYLTAGSRDRAGTVKQLLALFGVAKLDALWFTWEHGNVAYRRGAVGRHDSPKLTAWLALGEREALPRELTDYDGHGLAALIPGLRSLSREDPAHYIPEIVRLLATTGVALVFVPEVPGLGTYGATRWVDGHPIVQLSLRQKTDDHLWFTLFHELGHVLHDGRKNLYLVGDQNDTEARADRFASDTLIPPNYVARLPITRNIEAITALAEELGIAPGIVLGRTHRETGDYAWGHALKKKFEFATTRPAA